MNYETIEHEVRSQLRRRVRAIESRMREREDAGGLLDELLELRAELREWEKP